MTRPQVSIVVPAYNEEKRLAKFLGQLADFCARSSRIYEIIVVDDGSQDQTAVIAGSFREKFNMLEVIRLTKNRGKGNAVKEGLLNARGDFCLFIDADGSTQPDEIEKNLHYLESGGYDIFIGSRVLTSAGTVLKTKWHRKWMGRIFNYLVRTLLFAQIKDTQCGFKIFRKEAVGPLFNRCHLRGFGFDMEILYLAHKIGYKIREGPVSWADADGSKVNLIIDPLKMFVNILQIRYWHSAAFKKFAGPD